MLVRLAARCLAELLELFLALLAALLLGIAGVGLVLWGGWRLLILLVADPVVFSLILVLAGLFLVLGAVRALRVIPRR